MVRQHVGSRSGRATRKGFTLVELMIVVIIVAVLAGIAFSAYSRWIADARMSEAHAMMSDIRAKEEAYYNTWGSYLSAGANPTSVPTNGKGAWDGSQEAWLDLGVAPTGGTYFQYQVFAYSAGSGAGAEATSLGVDTNRDWFYISAKGDLDNSGSVYTEMYVSSQNSTPKILNEGH